MKKHNWKRTPAGERTLKATACVLTVASILILLYPLLYTVTCALQDNGKIYETPPSLLPDAAQSLSIEIDYTGTGLAGEALEQAVLQDAAVAYFSTVHKLSKDSIFEIMLYGTMDGKTIFTSRAHKLKLELEKDFGPYRGANVNQDVLLHGDRYSRALEAIGYRYSAAGLEDAVPEEGLDDQHYTPLLRSLYSESFSLQGSLVRCGQQSKNSLLAENFLYYLQLPAYVYAQNQTVAKYSFGAFFFNTLLVLAWALLSQLVLCSLSAFSVSRLMGKTTGNLVLLFFLGGTMIPFASIMVPQLIMYRSLGFYNNYLALLIPHLCPTGFYIYLLKGFMDRIPSSLFEAARIDGASNIFLYLRVCLPLSKPILSMVGLQVFLSNWNDFFWAYMVTEDQNLWTLNVALYNLSNNMAVKQNFIMGLSVVTILPILLVTLLFARQLKAGIMNAAVKE